LFQRGSIILSILVPFYKVRIERINSAGDGRDKIAVSRETVVEVQLEVMVNLNMRFPYVVPRFPFFLGHRSAPVHALQYIFEYFTVAFSLCSHIVRRLRPCPPEIEICSLQSSSGSTHLHLQVNTVPSYRALA